MTRATLLRLGAHLATASGLAWVARKLLTARGVFVLMFHRVAARRYDGVSTDLQPAMTRADLEAVLHWLAARFRLLDPKAALAGQRGVLLTFDDGFANNAEQVLPALERFAAPAIFFVATRHVRNPRCWLPSVRRSLDNASLTSIPERVQHDLFDGMSREQLAAVASSPLITVGGHTENHPLLTRCAQQELEREVAGSRRWLQEATGQSVSWFAYPSGAYDETVAAAVAEAGFQFAVVEQPVGIGRPLLEIPRIGIYESCPATLSSKLSGLHRRPWRPP